MRPEKNPDKNTFITGNHLVIPFCKICHSILFPNFLYLLPAANPSNPVNKFCHYSNSLCGSSFLREFFPISFGTFLNLLLFLFDCKVGTIFNT